MFKSIKLLILGFAGIAGTIGGIVLTSSSKESKTKQEIAPPIQYANSDKKRTHNINGFSEERQTTECFIYWIEGVTYNSETSALGFDKLKGKYSKREEFLVAANISQDNNIRDHYPFSLACENQDKGYYYFWQEETISNEWTRRKGSKLGDSIRVE